MNIDNGFGAGYPAAMINKIVGAGYPAPNDDCMKISLKQAIDFHGHLGPYLVLGLLMGEYGLKKIKAKPHFGVKVKVWGKG